MIDCCANCEFSRMEYSKNLLICCMPVLNPNDFPDGGKEYGVKVVDSDGLCEVFTEDEEKYCNDSWETKACIEMGR